MPASNSTARKRTLQLVSKPLTDEQIAKLTNQVCAGGDEPNSHAKALLILAEEIVTHREQAESIAIVIQRVAFSQLSDDFIADYVRRARRELLDK